MQQDIVQRQQRLAQTQQAKDAIAAKTQELQLEARLYQMQSQGLDTALTSETQQLSEQLQQLNRMGKPTEPAHGGSSSRCSSVCQHSCGDWHSCPAP